MRLCHRHRKNQLFKILCIVPLVAAVFFSTCRRSQEELPVLPPSTHPLARDCIGYGVVNVSFTHLLSDKGPGGISQGYLRRGTVVRIIERTQLKAGTSFESWVMVESNYSGNVNITSGWLAETNLEVYEYESQANTASKILSQ